MSPVARALAALSLVTMFAEVSSAQNINILTRPGGVMGQEDKTQFAVPAGASAGIAADGDDAGQAGPVLGFQVWRRDATFFSIFFSYAGSDRVSGGPDAFGPFLLNPTTDGKSFYTSGSHSIKTISDYFVVGLGGRAGISTTRWEANVGGTDQSPEGFVLYANPVVQMSSKTFVVDQNEYQVGIDVGPSWRMIGGDLAQSDAFRSSSDVLGVADQSFLGFETTVFMRLNSLQPFVRLTSFSAEKDIPGFSGTQAYFGVNVLSPLFRGDM